MDFKFKVNDPIAFNMKKNIYTIDEIRKIVEKSGINFLEEIYFCANFHLRLDLSKAKVSSSYQGAMEWTDGIFMTVLPDYNSYQNWEYKIQLTLNGDQNYPICILGSKEDYYSNPTMEIPNSNTLWFGVTGKSTHWQYNTNIITDEPFTNGTTYDFYLGWDGEEIYCKAYNADTNTLIGIETIAAAANPQRNPNPTGNPCILNNGNASRFRFLGTVNLMNCYFKANGEILWGRKK